MTAARAKRCFCAGYIIIERGELIVKAIAAFLAALMAFFYNLFGWCDMTNRYQFQVDVSSQGVLIGNMAKCINLWDMGTSFYAPQKNEKYDIYEFVEYVQLMQCTGGSLSRDLFVDPSDRDVLDDYDFTRLVKNCAGILSLGAKPHLKLGGVPLKYTTDPQGCVFSENANPPDDYDVYYAYIRACAQALVDAFGVQEVKTWHFGVMTEYENADWFFAKDRDPVHTAQEFCKLYDYTVGALQDVLGEDIYVGAHSMTVTEGLWDEEVFIRHCAIGTNYCTGKKGSRLSYLSASFYDIRPGEFTSGKTLPETIAYLRKTAERYGFKHLDYGIDEGRILVGNHSGADSTELLSRSAGDTWQGAYDARQYGQMLDGGIGYFSYWGYLTGGLSDGFPTISYHVAKLISQYEGSRLVPVKTTFRGTNYQAEVSAHAAYNESTRTLRAFVYNFKNDLSYFRPAKTMLTIDAPQFADGDVTVTVWRIDDDCNYFDEWTADREANGITDDMFSWSPDDGCLSSMRDQQAKDLFYQNYDKYEACAALSPQTYTAEVRNGRITLTDNIPANTAIFYEING